MNNEPQDIEPQKMQGVTDDDRMHPLAKENFLEGATQKWCVVAVLIGLMCMGLECFGLIHDPQTYLGFFTIIFGGLIAGNKGSDMIKAYCYSQTTTAAINNSVVTASSNNVSTNIQETITRKVDPKDLDDGTVD